MTNKQNDYLKAATKSDGLQPLNASGAMLVRLAGKMISVSDLQYANAYPLMVVRPSGKMIFVSDVQP